MDRRGRWGWLIGLAVIGAAVATELRKAPEQRTWHGRVAGIVPYDFRPPTFDKLQRAWWSPDEGLFSESPFGVGWNLNFGRLARLLASVGARFGQASA